MRIGSPRCTEHFGSVRINDAPCQTTRCEFDMVMTTFHTKKTTGRDNIDILNYRRMVAKGTLLSE